MCVLHPLLVIYFVVRLRNNIFVIQETIINNTIAAATSKKECCFKNSVDIQIKRHSLDVTVQKEILDLLRGLEGDLAILFICHDISLVQQFCHRVLVMHRGEIVEQGTPDEVICRPQHAYTRHLIDSVL